MWKKLLWWYGMNGRLENKEYDGNGNVISIWKWNEWMNDDLTFSKMNIHYYSEQKLETVYMLMVLFCELVIRAHTDTKTNTK